MERETGREVETTSEASKANGDLNMEHHVTGEHVEGVSVEEIRSQSILSSIGQTATRRPHHHGFVRHPGDY